MENCRKVLSRHFSFRFLVINIILQAVGWEVGQKIFRWHSIFKGTWLPLFDTRFLMPKQTENFYLFVFVFVSHLEKLFRLLVSLANFFGVISKNLLKLFLAAKWTNIVDAVCIVITIRVCSAMTFINIDTLLKISNEFMP